jgi:hypothetical protein
MFARLRQLVLLLAAVTALAACAGPPVQEMSDARQAINAAEEAGAGEHAPGLLQQARISLNAAEKKLEKRAYNGARRDAREARRRATEALRVAGQSGSP